MNLASAGCFAHKRLRLKTVLPVSVIFVLSDQLVVLSAMQDYADHEAGYAVEDASIDGLTYMLARSDMQNELLK